MPGSWSLVRELAEECPTALISLTEFADLLGLDESGAAQLRTARKRDRSTDASGHHTVPFPDVVAESGRTFTHRLGALVGWIEAVDWFRAGRGGREMDDDRAAKAVEAWRLHHHLRQLVDDRGLQASRVAVARFITDRDTRGLPEQLVALLEASTRTPELLDDVLVELGRGQPGVPSRTSSELAWLVAVALDAAPGMAVHDPTCGECEILLQVAKLAARRHEQLGPITGNDRDSDALAIGAARLALAGVPFEATTPDANTIARLVLDPGWDDPAPPLSEWLQLLTAGGRVALLTRISGDVAHLTLDLPPQLIILPPQRFATAQGAVAIWISEPLRETPDWCRIVDLRRNTTTDQSPLAERLSRFNAALQPHRPLRPANDADWDRTLERVSSKLVTVADVPASELFHYLSDAVSGRTGHSAQVVEANRRYAAALAYELYRLIESVPDDHIDGSGHLTAPDDSPPGVLAPLASDEARRVLRRLTSTFSGLPRRRQ